MKINLPNTLTVFRIILVPFFMFFMFFPVPETDNDYISRILAAAIFLIASLTDFADGKIARRLNIVTDFGKFLDPLADKFMVFGAILGLCSSKAYITGYGNGNLHAAIVIGGIIVIFRELAITSLRLVVSGGKKPVVIAASWFGKVKTFIQCVFVMVTILEPVIIPNTWYLFEKHFLIWITLIAMTAITIYSGYDYIKKYWIYIDPER